VSSTSYITNIKKPRTRGLTESQKVNHLSMGRQIMFIWHKFTAISSYRGT